MKEYFYFRKLITHLQSVNTKILSISVTLGFIFALLTGYLAQQYMKQTEEQRLMNLKNLVELARNSIEPVLVQYRKGHISKDNALVEVTNLVRRMVYHDHKGDNYIFMGSYKGVFLVVPFDQEKEMTNMWDLQDRNGVFLVREVVEVAQAEKQGGYVSYHFNVPGTSNVEEKTSFVLGIPELDCYIGTGIYMDDIRKNQNTFIFKTICLVAAFLVLLIILNIFSLKEIRNQNLKLQREITDRKLAEKELRLTKYSVDNGSSAVCWFNQNGQFVYANKAASKLTGYSNHELLDCYQWDIDSSSSLDTFNTLWEEVEEKGTERFERFVLDKKGKQTPIEANANYHEFEGEKFVFVTMLDITKRRKSEMERNLLASAIEQSHDDITITDLEGNIEYVNPAFERNTGYSQTEIYGKNPRILKSGEQDDAFYQDLWATITSGNIWTGNVINRCKNGKLIEEFATVFPVSASDGEIKNYVSVKRDITEQNRIENQLQQAQKMETIGTLVSGIAHDFNNILTPIFSYSQLLERKLQTDDEKILKFIGGISTAATRAFDLVTQLLNISRRDESKKEVVDTMPIIEETIKLLRSALPATINIQTKYEAESSHVLGDPSQIHQVLMNLGINAGHAMKENDVGTLEVKVSNLIEHLGNLGIKKGSYLLITVRDTGEGMSQETKERIFDPFYTTKKKGEGTGLGLSVSYRIIDSLGGYIRVYSELGKGSKFQVYLPVVKGHLVEDSQTQEDIPSGEETILLVDDEESIVSCYTELLEDQGYTVEGYTDSETAHEALLSNPEKYDLVLTDYTMPNITGIKLIEKIRKQNIETPAVLISGLSETIYENDLDRVGIKKKLSKPIALYDLAVTVRSALDE